MVKQSRPYQRIARGSFGVAGVGSLWIGPDHLLYVTQAFAMENYRRWFYHDIQAFIVRRTIQRLVWNLVVGLGGLFMLAAAVAVGFGSGQQPSSEAAVLVTFSVIFGICAGIAAIIVLANTLSGPTCIVYVQTPFGLHPLPLPKRVRAFERMLKRLRPVIERAQASASGSATESTGTLS